jgi:hypothetical protein
VKTAEDYFQDWEQHAFGFGYGTGEPHVLGALRQFFGFVDARRGRAYEYMELERGLGAATAWLLVNRLCRYDVSVVDYGVSPRHGWLTAHGTKLCDFMLSSTVEELVRICTEWPEDHVACVPDLCQCGAGNGKKCPNPFWDDNRRLPA